MFIELVDALRCPNQHEETWLVASADRMEARHIVTGTLGCPVCGAQFAIENGVVDLRTDAATSAAPHGDDPIQPVPPSREAGKLAALLDLADASGFAVLLDEWGALAHTLAELVETPLIAVNPPEHVVGAPGISVVRCEGALPLATSAARAVATGNNEARTAEAVRVVKPGGRVVAPATLSTPAEVRELARDEELWVGERGPVASPLVALHVRRS